VNDVIYVKNLKADERIISKTQTVTVIGSLKKTITTYYHMSRYNYIYTDYEKTLQNSSDRVTTEMC